MRMGLMQGRLSLPTDGYIQEFPENWREEFEYLDKYGFTHIEWLITKRKSTNNPILNENLYFGNLPISSICVDTLVDTRIVDKNYLEKFLQPVCRSAIRNKINTITIPLLEDSNVENLKVRDAFKKNILKYAKEYPNLKFSFECELSIEGLQDILKLSDNFYVTYDTGNITSYGLEHGEYIDSFYSRINNVHLKDRTFNSQTVCPTFGDTNFTLIFNKLRLKNYNGLYTLQTARGETGKEIKTMIQHKNILERIYNEK
jgi:hypothetical protein